MNKIKNISKAEVLTLKEQVSYQPGQVVSKTLAQNGYVSVTLFAFDKDEEIVNEIKALEKEFEGNGRVLIRTSGTEPLVRVMLEGEDIQYLKTKAENLAALISKKLG